MSRTAQNIRFCTSRDGVRIAYATCGEGPPLVRVGHIVTHLEADWDCLVWRPLLEELSRRHTLVRYDLRGCGLSDREGLEFSFDKFVEDLDAVIEAVGLERFALLGVSGGGAPAVAYAVAHTEKVSHLILYGAFTRGRIARGATNEQLEESETLLRLIEHGWSKEDPSFRQLFASQALPDGTVEQIRSFNQLMRLSCTSVNAVKLMRANYTADVYTLAPQVRCPALVLHPRGDLRIPFEEGRSLARLIPGARFVPLDSRNHFLLEQDIAWKQWVAEFNAFLPASTKASGPAQKASLEGLTPRENDVLELVAQGLGNEVIAERLGMSEKTVRNHVSALLSKLGLNSRSQVIVHAREKGFGRTSSG